MIDIFENSFQPGCNHIHLIKQDLFYRIFSECFFLNCQHNNANAFSHVFKQTSMIRGCFAINADLLFGQTYTYIWFSTTGQITKLQNDAAKSL